MEQENKFQWYVLRVAKGLDNQVKRRLIEKIRKYDYESLYQNIVIPTEQYFEVKNGKRIQKERNILSGYVLIHADLKLDEARDHQTKQLNNKRMSLIEVIETCPGCHGFLEKVGKSPKATPEHEVKRLLGIMEERNDVPAWSVDEWVKIIQGPFKNFEGKIASLDHAKQKMGVEVRIFDRSTPVELDWVSVEKIQVPA